jgi:cell division protein FtsB
MKRPVFSWKYALMILGVVVLAYMVMDFNNRVSELHRLSNQKEAVAAEVSSLEKTQNALETKIAYATSEAAVVDWAYEEGHMVGPGDNPVVPIAPSVGTPFPTPTPSVTQQAVSNWQMWMRLFLDSEAPRN